MAPSLPLESSLFWLINGRRDVNVEITPTNCDFEALIPLSLLVAC